jgi:hypothetical protein
MDGPSIVWVRQFGPAAEVVANAGSRRVLSIEVLAIQGAEPDEIGIGTGRDGV